jgi:hypothetical protein
MHVTKFKIFPFGQSKNEKMKFSTSTALAALASMIMASVSGQTHGGKTRGRALSGGDGPYGGKGSRKKRMVSTSISFPHSQIMITLLGLLTFMYIVPQRVGVRVPRVLLL